MFAIYKEDGDITRLTINLFTITISAKLHMIFALTFILQIGKVKNSFTNLVCHKNAVRTWPSLNLPKILSSHTFGLVPESIKDSCYVNLRLYCNSSAKISAKSS